MTIQPDATSMPPPDRLWLKGWNDAIRAIAEAGIRPNAPTQSPAEAYSTAVAVEQMAYQGERLALYGNLGRDLVSAREQLAACNTSHATVAARAVRHKAALEKAKAQVARVKALHHPGTAAPPVCVHCRREWPCPTIQALEDTP